MAAVGGVTRDAGLAAVGEGSVVSRDGAAGGLGTGAVADVGAGVAGAGAGVIAGADAGFAGGAASASAFFGIPASAPLIYRPVTIKAAIASIAPSAMYKPG